MYRENNKGPRTVPWGTPDKTGAQSDFTPFTTTRHSIFPVRRRNFKSQNILCAEAELRSFKSQDIPCTEAELQITVYAKYICFLIKGPKVPGAQGRRPLGQSHLGGTVRYCAILDHLGGGPYWYFSWLRYYQNGKHKSPGRATSRSRIQPLPGGRE